MKMIQVLLLISFILSFLIRPLLLDEIDFENSVLFWMRQNKTHSIQIWKQIILSFYIFDEHLSKCFKPKPMRIQVVIAYLHKE